MTGKLDAFEWRQPDERLGYIEAMPEVPEAIETKQAPPALSAPETAPKETAKEIAPSDSDAGDGSPEISPLAAEADSETEPEAARPRRGRRAAAARPVMFPQPVPPDDPGTEPEKVTRVV